MISVNQCSFFFWYHPQTGRFLGEDPIQEGSNWYRYAGNPELRIRLFFRRIFAISASVISSSIFPMFCDLRYYSLLLRPKIIIQT